MRVRNRQVRAGCRKFIELVEIHFLELVGDIFAQEAFTQCHPLTVLAKITVGAPLSRGHLVGGCSLTNLAAARQVGQPASSRCAHHFAQPRIGTEEVLAGYNRPFERHISGTAVHPSRSSSEAGAPSTSLANSSSSPFPDHLITFQTGARKTISSSWMIFPLPRTGPSSRCRLSS